MPSPRRAIFSLLMLCIPLVGCHASQPGAAAMRPDPQLSSPPFCQVLQAYCTPPKNWKPDPIKQTSVHAHEVWISPSGRTAYGVIYFHLPLPVGHELALWGFLNEMRSSEGEATLLEKRWDPNLNALRFVAQGGKYIVRTNLFVRGFTGWAIYAGTLRAFPINPEELDLARRAREHTVVGPSR